jgi:hypothetical protein
MARFELHLFIVSENNGTIQSSEVKSMCWVNNSNDMAEIEEVAEDVISENIEINQNVVLFGHASLKVRGEEVMSLSFRNDNADKEKMGIALDLMELADEGEAIH